MKERKTTIAGTVFILLITLFGYAYLHTGIHGQEQKKLKQEEFDTKEPVRNPYYKTRKWKLWLKDSSPVKVRDKTLKLPEPDKLLYPDDADTAKNPGLFLAYRNKDWDGRKYAGMWDDVYCTLDGKHSYVRKSWSGKYRNRVTIIDSTSLLSTLCTKASCIFYTR